MTSADPIPSWMRRGVLGRALWAGVSLTLATLERDEEMHGRN